jgi:hypothetical protein
MAHLDRYWYAPVLAAPVPELPERVAVGVVFGNGTLQHLEIDPQLSRLKGILSKDHRQVLELSLQHAASLLSRTESLEALSSILGVQFTIGQPRELLQPYSRASVRSISRAYLEFHKSPRVQDSGLIRESLLALDREIEPIMPAGVSYQKKRITVDDLYPGIAGRYQTVQIGDLRRLVLGDSRHLILSSAIIRESEKSHLDSIVQRAIRQAYFIGRLRSEIRLRSKIDVKFVGVLQPLDAKSTSESRVLRDFYTEQWSQALDGVLTPTSESQAQEMLAENLDWVSLRAA